MLPDTGELLVFLAAGLALALTPGPDMLYVVARSCAGGRTLGLTSALGIGAGTFVHIILVALGLASFLAAVPTAYTAVRIAGAAYLVYLGIRVLRADSDKVEYTLTGSSRVAAFRQGLLTNVLNPKVALFFLAFLPQFIDPARGPAAIQVAVLGLMFNLMGTLVNLLVAAFAGTLAARAGASARSRRALRRASGAVFIGLGVRLALTAK
jgi:threonine/homoserine/homoserine lactone efflux protein